MRRLPRRVLIAIGALLAAGAAALGLHLALATHDTVFSWKRPANLGLHADGRLARCRRTPNCVSSQAPQDDAVHFVAPIAFRGSAREALAAVRDALAGLPRVTIVREDAGYLYAECRSRVLRFVDDIEFAHDAAAGLIHVRSASRLGRRDFGVNRARVEALRARITAPAKTGGG